VGSSKNPGRATFRKMPEAGLKIAQKGLKTRFLSKEQRILLINIFLLM